MISLPKKFRAPITLSLALVALTAFLPGCTHRKVVQIGSHKVTVLRHGFEKKFYVKEDASAPTFEYGGLTADGRGLKVAIQGDKVTVNGVSGRLRPGDRVLISDDGVAVNDLDYGESEKYLRANVSPANEIVLN
jgi:hypothetical protein